MLAHRLALGAVVGPALFTAAWLLLGFVSPGYTLFGTHIAPYSAISQPISGLGLGQTAPLMNAAFIASGLLLIIGVAGALSVLDELPAAARAMCAALLVLPGIGSIVDGIFTLESMAAHSAGFMLVLAPIVAFPMTGMLLRKTRWRRMGTWLIAAGPLTLLLAVAFFLSFNPDAAGAGAGVAGLTQRALIIGIHAGYVSLGWTAHRA